jgi:hypothetical protein
MTSAAPAASPRITVVMVTTEWTLSDDDDDDDDDKSEASKALPSATSDGPVK